MFATLLRESERLSTASLPDEDEIDHVKTDTFAPWLPQNPKTDTLSCINIDPDADIELQTALIALCKEFEDIFSVELPAEPARVPPFKLKVDIDKWKIPRNRGPPRQQTALKQAEFASGPLVVLETLK